MHLIVNRCLPEVATARPLVIKSATNPKTFLRNKLMKISLSEPSLKSINENLSLSNGAFVTRYPGETGRRQPVHTVYGGAHLFRADSAQRLGQVAERGLLEYAPNFVVFARAIGLPRSTELPDVLNYATGLRHRLDTDAQAVREENQPAWLAYTIYSRVQEKLKREPVEDFRIDFEDGYGNRPDTEEDGHAESAAVEVVGGLTEATLSPNIGLRIKPFTEELKRRAIRTLDLFLTALVRETGGRLPGNFVVTLPKVTVPDQAAALAQLLELLERHLDLPERTLPFEIMIETPQAVLDETGSASLLRLVGAGRGRCVAAHFGTYDYTASLNVTAAYQQMTHPACDFAKNVMQVALAGTGVWISDGATNILPVPPHRSGP